MEINKLRDQFEVWARSKGLDLEYRNIPGVGQFYECPRTLLALEAWQASREAVLVELPEPWPHYGIMGDANDPEMVVDHAYVVKAIKAQGLQVKS